jgi:hypothetical protein
MEQLSVVWHDIQQLVAASEGSPAGASLGGLSAILTTSTLNRSALLFVILLFPTRIFPAAARTRFRLRSAASLGHPPVLRWNLLAPLPHYRLQLSELQNLPRTLLLLLLQRLPPSKAKALLAPSTREFLRLGVPHLHLAASLTGRYRSSSRAMAMRLCCGGGNAEEIGSIIGAACSREDWAQALFFCFLIPDISRSVLRCRTSVLFP